MAHIVEADLTEEWLILLGLVLTEEWLIWLVLVTLSTITVDLLIFDSRAMIKW